MADLLLGKIVSECSTVPAMRSHLSLLVFGKMSRQLVVKTQLSCLGYTRMLNRHVLQSQIENGRMEMTTKDGYY